MDKPCTTISNHQQPPDHAGERSARALRTWLVEQVEITSERVALGHEHRHYEIFHPSAAATDHMFATATESSERPYWAQVWASGIGLGRCVLRRRDELDGLQVLELGCGLGVTAAAAIEAGASLVAVDLSELSLGFCRYNSLMNAGDAPTTIALNWRSPDPAARSQLWDYGQFPVILAADVLYESRDIEPLINVIDELLAPDGMLWLAEPNRETARRMLYRLAELGWRIRSERADVTRYRDQREPVHIHYIQRPSSVDWLRTSTGGWRP
ncbi:MAG: class I SAM-dependent methyltransferase [Chloroflexota bacterium]